MNRDFKERLKKLRESPDASKTTMQTIYLEFNEPIGQLEAFLHKIVDVSILIALGLFLFSCAQLADFC
jgi:hypothetical protein